MGNITRKILLLLVIVSIFVVATEGRSKRRRRNRHCPSSDDEDHVCCEWKTKTYQIPFSECSACTTPTPENELCSYSRRRQQYFCRYTYFMNVTKVECEAKCCDGWTIDEHGQCSVRADEQQDIICENGGSPAGDYCSCPIGFVGTHCETAVCTPICLNNGVCGGRDGKAVCICPERNFTGEQCEIPVCDPKCKNGGSCVETGYESKCACMPGFTGQSCEKEIKDGECPDTSGISTCQVECDDDFQCPGRKKCCINGCGGGVCVYPANTTCTHSGQQYPVGDITVMSPCKMCYCFDPNSQGDKQWRCIVMDCPILTCEHRKTIPDVCCPVCDDTTTNAPTTIVRTTRAPTTTSPTTFTCWDNGIQYPGGAVITRNDNCASCVCTWEKYHIVPGWKCKNTKCPMLTCLYTRKIEGTCCEVCAEPPTTLKPEITTNHPRGCRFNGTDYPHMAEIRKSDCESCRCYYQYGGHMNWECRISDCAFPPCQNPIKRPGQCCPVCLGTSSTTTPRTVQTTLSPDNAPYFKHCPKERLILSTLGRNYVDIRAQVNLTVVDKSGKKYAVRYSETLITAKPCNCSENYHIIIARSEVDKYGRFASCMFNVHVFDNNPPVYKTCPTSIAAFEDEIITWDIPEAYDNVAIKSEKFKSLHENNSKFKVGSHVVMYILIDDQGNIGICNFLVAIYERGTTDPTAPLELKNGDEKDKRVLINVVIGALTGLIALTMIAIVFAFYRRRRNQNLASGNAHPVSGYDNGIYATPNTPPPSYGRSSGAKLPPKYMVRDDKLPVYEEVDVKALSQKKGVQNPIYDSTDDLDLGQRIRPKLEMKEETNA